MLRKILDIRQEEAFYHSTHYQSYSLDSKDSWLGYPVQDLVELGIDISKKKKNSSFLDLGAGVGRNSIPIVKSNLYNQVKIDCVDILPTAIEQFSEYAQEYNILDSFNFFVSDIFNFDLSNKKYDYIFSVSTLEHLENKEQLLTVLESIKNATEEMGVIYLVINSNVTEYSVEQQQEILPYLEINLSTKEMENILNEIFKGWNILNREVKHLIFPLERSIGQVKMTTNAITFVAQKKLVI